MPDYQAAFEREKKARKVAEKVLEDMSRELYLVNDQLKNQYDKMISEFKQKTLLLQISQYSQDMIKLSELLPDIISSMLSMATLPFGIFDYFPYDKSRDNYRSPVYTNNNLSDTQSSTSTFDEILVGDFLNDMTADVIREQHGKYIDNPLGLVEGDARNVMEQHKIEGVMVIPIIANNHAVAILYLFVNDESTSVGDYMELFSSSVKQLGYLVEHRYNEEKLEANYKQLKSTVNELNLTQKQLVQSEKMASVGQLSSGIAHEINNPMGYIKSNINSLTKYQDIYKQGFLFLQALLAEPDNEKRLSELDKYWQKNDLSYLLNDTDILLEETQQGIARVINIVSGLKSFARASDEKWTKISINDCVEEALKFSHNQLKYNVTIEKNLADVPAIKGNAGELTQVILNLLINAGHAIEKDGEITICSQLINDRVVLSIADSGMGIEPENLKHIFDPFFTTKEVGEGTGLGLSISFGIIQNHLGSIDVKSAVDKGTTFTISLPVALGNDSDDDLGNNGL